MKKKVAIFQQDLSVGGIQKALISILNSLDYSQLKVDLYLFSQDNFYSEIPHDVNIIYIKKCNKILKYLPFAFFKKLRRNFVLGKKYDLAIDFNGYQNDTAFGVLCTNALRKVLWIHSDLEKRYEYERKYRYIFKVSKNKFSIYNQFVFVSEGAKEAFQRLYSLKDKKTFVIPNYLDTKLIVEKAQEECDLKVNDQVYNLVTMGRMVYAKGFDLLLDDFKKVLSYRKDVHLYFIGDGVERKNLEKKVQENNLTNYVTFLGKHSNPYKYLKVMDGFVLTSRYEGQGIVIMEAKTLGLDIFISKNLEKYNIGIKGYDDISKALSQASRRDKKIDLLENYNNKIKKYLNDLFYR